MDGDVGNFIVQLLQIIGVNIILSGDNAVVIALACRGLPTKSRKIGIIAGAGVAIVLRIIFTLMVVSLLSLPWLRLVGSLLLLWISVKLLTDENDEANVEEAASVWHAVRIVAIADMIMSLDNVLAIAGVAKDSNFLVVLGLAISIPLIVFGAQLIITLIERFPWLVWAGAALLGYVSGDMLASEPVIAPQVGAFTGALNAIVDPVVGRLPDLAGSFVKVVADPHRLLGLVGALLVIGAGYALKKRKHGEAENPA